MADLEVKPQREKRSKEEKQARKEKKERERAQAMEVDEAEPAKKEKKEKKEKSRKHKEDNTDVNMDTVIPSTANAEASTSSLPPSNLDTTSSFSKKRKRSEKLAKEEGEAEDELEIDLKAPVPLSKAQLRAEKKKQKSGGAVAAEGDEGDAAEDGDAAGESRPAKRVKREKKDVDKPPAKKNSIWIGNLAFKTSADGLKAWFDKKISEMEGSVDPKVEAGEEGKGGQVVTRVNLPMKQGRAGWAQQSQG